MAKKRCRKAKKKWNKRFQKKRYCRNNINRSSSSVSSSTTGEETNVVIPTITTSLTKDTPSVSVVESASSKKLKKGVDPDCYYFRESISLHNHIQ